MATHSDKPPRGAKSAPAAARSTANSSRNENIKPTQNSKQHKTGNAAPKAAASRPAKDEDDFLASQQAPYRSQLKTLRELFGGSAWKDEDLISVLQEVQGDLDVAIGRISEGYAEHWSTQETKKQRRDHKKIDLQQAQQQPQQATKQERPKDQSHRGRGRGGGRGGARTNAIGGMTGGRPPASVRATEEAVVGTEIPSNVLTVEEIENGWNNSGASATDDWGTSSVAATIGSESHASSWDDGKPASSGWNTESSKAKPAAASASKASTGGATRPTIDKTPKAANSKSTWAQIAKPDPPKVEPPAPVPTQSRSTQRQKPDASTTVAPASSAPRQSSPVRSKTPTRTGPAYSAAAASDIGVTTQSTVPVRDEVKATSVTAASIVASGPASRQSPAGPPGLPVQGLTAQQQQQAQQRKIKSEAPVVMPMNAHLTSVGVKFGSLSLNDDSEAIESKPKLAAPVAQISPSPTMNTGRTAGSTPSMPHQSTAAAHMYGNFPPQPPAAEAGPYYGGLNANEFYGETRAGADVSAAAPPSGPPGQAGAYPVNAANLANMYAAYFPYYMNQFPGTNPYAPSGPAHPAAGNYGHQTFNPMNKYPVYPPAGGAAPSASSLGGTNVSQPSSVKSNTATPAAGAGLYGGYNPYYQQQQQPHMDDPSLSQSQEAYNKYQTFLGGAGNAKQANPDLKQQDKTSSVPNSGMPYYNQYAAPQYPNFTYGQQHQAGPVPGNRMQQQQQQQQQPYWNQ